MEQLQPVLDFLLAFWQGSLVKWILLTTVVNVVTALAAAVHTGDFQFRKIGEFLYRKVLPYGGLYAVYWIIGQAIDMEALTVAAFAAVELALASDLIESLGELGIPVPEPLWRAVAKPE